MCMHAHMLHVYECLYLCVMFFNECSYACMYVCIYVPRYVSTYVSMYVYVVCMAMLYFAQRPGVPGGVWDGVRVPHPPPPNSSPFAGESEAERALNETAGPQTHAGPMGGGPGRMREDREGCGEDLGGCGEDRGGC